MDFRRAIAANAALGILVLSFLTAACGPSRSTISAERRDSLIQQLQAAKELDFSHASDPRTGPVASADYLAQAAKADRAIRQLSSGLGVAESYLDDALVVPSGIASPQRTAQLIEKLKEAKRLDDRGAAEHSDDPTIAEDFIAQAQRANKAIGALEAGAKVSPSDVIEALQVPKNR
jgi:hypothetical protein